ncbi:MULTISPECIES: hypothetical protein [Okeania]|nr:MULTISPECIES: hypothetical protein [Okeania]
MKNIVDQAKSNNNNQLAIAIFGYNIMFPLRYNIMFPLRGSYANG